MPGSPVHDAQTSLTFRQVQLSAFTEVLTPETSVQLGVRQLYNIVQDIDAKQAACKRCSMTVNTSPALRSSHTS